MSTNSSRTKEIISGLTAGSLSTIVSHPLDLIKIRLQLDTSTRTSHFQSFQRILRELLTNRGSTAENNHKIRTIYRGLSINVLGNAVSWSLYFALYNEFKSLVLPPHNNGSKVAKGGVSLGNPSTSPGVLYHKYMLCSFASGAVTTLLTNPIWVLKTRLLSTDKSTPGAYRNIYDGVTKILKSERGWRIFFKGFTPGLISVSQGSLYFTIYDSLKHRHNLNNQNQQYDFWMYLYITSVSKTVSTTVFYPLQLIKTRLQSFGNETLTVRSVLATTYGKEGVSGLYRGLYVNLFRTLPSTCMTFLTYELMKTVL